MLWSALWKKLILTNQQPTLHHLVVKLKIKFSRCKNLLKSMAGLNFGSWGSYDERGILRQVSNPTDNPFWLLQNNNWLQGQNLVPNGPVLHQQYPGPLYLQPQFAGAQSFEMEQHLRYQQSRYYFRKAKSADNIAKPDLTGVEALIKVFSTRRWVDLKTKPSKNPFEFIVMSYNVLAQQLINEHLYLYRKHNKNALDWNTRWRNLFNEIKTMKPDILCLQEVQESHLKEYYTKLCELGYQDLYKKRTGLHCDGCAIYYKSDKFELVEYEKVEYYQPNVDVLNRDNIAIVAKLKPKNGSNRSKPIVVATTHLLYNPKRQDVRIAQTQLLLAEVERMAYYKNSKGFDKYLPIIITGDFNSTPCSSLYELITKGRLRYDHLKQKLLNEIGSPRHGNVLVPSHLQITDQCQYQLIREKRQNREEIIRQKEAALIKLHKSDKSVEKISTETVKNPELFNSGTLSHFFALQSVYRHGKPADPEATTHQDEWKTVDYIFYTGKKRQDNINENKLILTSFFKLPLSSELGSVTIPNSLIGSDHLFLAAKFRLTS